MSILDFRGQGPPRDIGQFQMACGVLVYKHTFSGTTYIVAARQGERGWVLVAHGTDASTVIQATINALDSLGGGLIWFKNGEYYLNGTITAKYYVDLVGEQKPEASNIGDNRGVMFINNNAVTKLIDLSNVGRFKIEQITFVSDNTTNDCALYLSSTAYVFIYRCTFNKFKNAIYATAGNGWGNRIIENRIVNSRDIDTYLLGSVHDFEFTNNDTLRIYVQNGLRVNIERNSFEGVMGANTRHLEVQDTNVVHIEDNHLETSLGSGANVRQMQITNCENVTIGLNYHVGNNLAGLYGIVTAISCERLIIEPNSRFVNCPTDIEDNSINKLRNNILSGTFAVDSIGLKTVTIAHGLTYTPSAQDIQASIVENTNVDDYFAYVVKIKDIGAANLSIDVYVATASATGGATAKISIHAGKP